MRGVVNVSQKWVYKVCVCVIYAYKNFSTLSGKVENSSYGYNMYYIVNLLYFKMEC